MNRPIERGLLLANLLPEFANELQVLLKKQGQTELAAQVPGLRVVDRCRCGDDFCATFYTQPEPQGSCGPGLECMDLDAHEGRVIVDVVDGTIMNVEVLYRDEIRQ
jgi:hypothetical protein